jgi:transposase
MNVYVGIDVSAKTVDLVYRDQGKHFKPEVFQQSSAGHRQLITRLQQLRPMLVVLESTGIYYLDLAIALVEAALPVAVINPKSARRFAELKLEHTKTDGVDAAVLAEFGERMSPPRWQAPQAKHLALRDVGRQINRLNAARTQAKNRLHALQGKAATLPLLIEDEREGIILLELRIEKLRQAALELIGESEELSAHLNHLIAARGIAQASAISVLGEFCVLGEQLKAPQVVRHAGLDVELHQSGSSVNRPGRLSKKGNTYLRAALYMPAMSAIQHEPRAKAFYEALVARGKKKMQALCAVMRKYLMGLWTCYRNGVPFDAGKLFSDCHAIKS